MKKRLFAVIALASLMGCATASVTRLSDNVYPPKPDDCDMKVLGNPPTDKKYEELGIVIGQGGTSLDDILPPMKAKACRLGADAIAMKNVDPGNQNTTNFKASAVAIKYSSDKQ